MTPPAIRGRTRRGWRRWCGFWPRRRRRPVLVGHGLFEDVIYLCENFLWELPATVDEFAGMVGGWPMVVNTQYMASQWFTADGPEAASLGQVEEALCEKEGPVICELS